MTPDECARGFILSERPVKIPHESWIARRLGKLYLAHDPRVPVAFAASPGKWVAILGIAVDVRDSGLSTQDIAARSASLGLTALLADTDYWAGRFLVVRSDGAVRRAFLDASGMRAIFYPLTGPMTIASHGHLLGRPFALHRAKIKALHAVRHVPSLSVYYPGRLTPWADVVQLTANVALNLEDRSLTRFWPRGELPQADIIPAMRAQVDALCATGRPVVVSLTAGIDSRLTLAATRNHRVRYFTYTTPGHASAMDVDAASLIADHLSLVHRVVPFGRATADDPLVQALRRSCVLAHGHAVAAAYKRTFPADAIHIRSNVSEIGRAFYRKRGQDGPVDAVAMARAWRKAENDPEMVAAFQDWIDAVAFPDGPLDPWDLFYHEHRMSMWHGNVVQESDIAFDTWSLFNCRAIMGALLAAPLEERLEAAVYSRLFDEYLPELRDMPINDRAMAATL